MEPYALFLDRQRLTCFIRLSERWEIFPLKGEESLDCADPAQLAEALEALKERQQWQPADQMLVLYQAQYQPWLPPLLAAMPDVPVMILPLASWLASATACDPLAKAPELYERHLLPLLWNQLARHDAPVKKHQLEVSSRTDEALVQQLQQEQQENLALREALGTALQHARQQQASWNNERARYEASQGHIEDLDMAAVAQFMPLFFAHFWQKVSPGDMAMLLGSLTLPEISSPWPEPNKSALAIKKRAFQQSRTRHQQQIKAIVRQFVEVGYLTVRPEMEPLLDD